MNDQQAREIATQLTGLLLTHQEDAFGKYPLASEDDAQRAAKALAMFRRTLIEELKKPSTPSV